MIVTIIPARGGSKGIPQKNIIDFCGKPLIAWSIEHAKTASLVDEVYVTSDSDEILNIAIEHRAQGIKRPDEFSTDTATSESALTHAVEYIIKKTGETPKYIVFLQATSPLRVATDVQRSIETIKEKQADSLFSSSPIEDFFIWEENDQGALDSVNFDYHNRKRRQDIKPQYVENGSLYIFKPEILTRHNNRLGGTISTFLMEPWQIYEIDSRFDLDMCAWIYRTKILTNA